MLKLRFCLCFQDTSMLTNGNVEIKVLSLFSGYVIYILMYDAVEIKVLSLFLRYVYSDKW